MQDTYSTRLNPEPQPRTGNYDARPPTTYPPMAMPPIQSETGYVTGSDATVPLLERLADLLSNSRDHLPKMEPEVFNGNLLKFPVWIKSFDAIIESHTQSPAERLYFLSKYTSGAAKEAIEGFLTLNDDQAYLRAKYTLNTRFGDRYKVSEAFMKKLHDWPVIKTNDGEHLRKFSDFLNHCNSAMASISYLRSLNSAEENKKLVSKLPKYLAGRWSRIIDRWLYRDSDEYDLTEDGAFPPFSVFCNFLTTESRIACGPGNTFDSSAKKEVKTHKRLTSFNMKTKSKTYVNSNKSQGHSERHQVTHNQLRCLFCKAPHIIDKCPEFTSKSAKEKKLFVSSHGLCFGCLKRGHLFVDCRRKNPTLMRDGSESTNVKSVMPSPNITTNDETKEKHNVNAHNYAVSTGDARMCQHAMIMPVVMHHESDPNLQITTYAMLDNQSNACFVSGSIIEKLDVNCDEVKLELTTMLDKNVIHSQLVKGLVIKGVCESSELRLPPTYSRSTIPANKNLIPRPENVRKWPHLIDVSCQLQPIKENLEIGLLIGFNCSAALLPRQVVAAGDDDPYAVRTLLGWGLTGIFENSDESQSSHFAFRTSVKEINSQQVKDMFERDFSENQRNDKISVNDTKFLNQVQESIHQREDGHFEIGLPFIEKDLFLPNNKIMAQKRLNTLKRKLCKDSEYKTHYITFMTDLISKGHAEKIPAEENDSTEGRTWYIPHHGVYNAKKPGKIRVVFDCSAEWKGQTLNQHLLSGPDLINNMSGILLRFRQERVAITCDIEGMYHQVGVNKSDRNFLRFLWWENGDVKRILTEYRMTVHLFGATSSPGCANFALKHTAEVFKDEYDDCTSSFIKHDFYVDGLCRRSKISTIKTRSYQTSKGK